MWSTIGRLQDEGTTILLTTHYMDEAQHLADRLVILRSGDVVAVVKSTAPQSLSDVSIDQVLLLQAELLQ